MVDKWDIIAQLTRAIADTPLDTTLSDRVGMACVNILGARGVSVSAGTFQSRTTLCVTDEYAAELGRLQQLYGEGPEPDAYRQGRPVRADFTATADARWTLLSSAVLAAIGPISVHSIPFQYTGDGYGVLTAHLLPGEEIIIDAPTAQFLADAAGVALLQHAAADPSATPSWDDEVHLRQATRQVMAQLRLSADDAFAVLRAYAFVHHETIDAIAAQLNEGRLDFLSSGPFNDPARGDHD